DGRLESYPGALTESIAHSYYRIPLRSSGGQSVVPAPDKPNASSWIKAPRTRHRAATVGALARLVVAQASAPQSAAADAAAEVEAAVGAPLAAHNTVAGRLLAGVVEVGLLVSRCFALLTAAKPGEPAATGSPRQLAVSAEGVGDVEAPAGALRHHVTLERGKIARYDVIAPSTWNGSPADQEGKTGPLLAALNGAELDLTQRESRLVASRIVHSFFFSQTDAVQ
ncbi:MAG TPA: nickel-dependent hydrogenase large subunit, partial [bacterium]|nr:nickel-dependent hydrogenase large subunit [bacterium]